MIPSNEIYLKAKELGIHTSDVQRDYLYGWVLNGIFTSSNLMGQIFLKGGQALRKGYFENTRYSKDLDLGISGDVDPNILMNDINNVCEYIHDKTHINFDISRNVVKEKFGQFDTPIPDLKVYEARIYFKDFYSQESCMTLRISMDLTRFDKVIAPLQEVNLIHPYSDLDSIKCTIKCVKLEEIIATKLKCLLQRQHAPDLFDYAYAIKRVGGSLNKEEVVRMLIQKTIFGKNPHMLKDILKNLSLGYFREYWNKTLICAKQATIHVENALDIFMQDLDEIFKYYPDNGYRDFAFFKPEFRSPIMEAGRNQTLLKVIYKGVERYIEPYALKYQQKRDGTEREYLYVYNCEGGEHNPGMRMFVAENLQFIENTNIKFTPRNDYQIELSKAGELPEDPYLFDPNKPMRETTILKRPHRPLSNRQNRTSFGIKYIYKCATCGKKFSRNSFNSNMGKHKNKNGYPCFGWYGIYMGTK